MRAPQETQVAQPQPSSLHAKQSAAARFARAIRRIRGGSIRTIIDVGTLTGGALIARGGRLITARRLCARRRRRIARDQPHRFTDSTWPNIYLFAAAVAGSNWVAERETCEREKKIIFIARFRGGRSGANQYRSIFANGGGKWPRQMDAAVCLLCARLVINRRARPRER